MTSSIVKKTDTFYNKFMKLGLTDTQEQLLKDYKLYIDASYNEFLMKKKKTISKYHKSKGGKIKNNMAQRRYYLKNKEKILLKKRKKYNEEKEKE